MSKSIHQFVHTLSYGDAISGEAVALKRELKAKGVDSEIYAINVHPELKGQAKSYLDFSSDFTGEIIFHLSLGSPLTELFRKCTKAKRTVIYHNMTPVKWIENINPRFRKDLERGFKELPEVCKLADRIIADSTFNAWELKQLGFNAEILPLFFDSKKWDIVSNQGITNILKNDDKLHLLHVGRLAPNKCVEDIIKSFYFLRHHIHQNSKLWLVGIDIDTELYSFTLKRMVDELDLNDSVEFPGCMADSELKAMYENADVYMCMSEHEGFCLPLVEAMHFGLPVIAYDAGAISETLGSGGILVNEKKHAELGELIYKIYKEDSFRKKLIEAGLKKVSEMSLEQFKEDIDRVLLSDLVVNDKINKVVGE